MPQRYAKDNRTAHLTTRSDKSVAYVTNNKVLYSTFCTVEANYWQTQSIARPLCDSRATCFSPHGSPTNLVLWVSNIFAKFWRGHGTRSKALRVVETMRITFLLTWYSNRFGYGAGSKLFTTLKKSNEKLFILTDCKSAIIYLHSTEANHASVSYGVVLRKGASITQFERCHCISMDPRTLGHILQRTSR